MTEKQLKELIREEYHNVKNFMEEKYGFVPELGQVVSNPYVSAFKVEDYLDEATDAEEKEFHSKLDKLVHKTFGKSPDEEKEDELKEDSRFSPMGYAKQVAMGKMSMEDAMKDTGYPFSVLVKLVKKFNKNYKFEGNETDAEMAVDQIETMVKRAEELITKLRGKSDLEPWVQSLITKAEDYISTVSDYGEVDEYDVETIEETRDFINFMKEYKSNINEAEYQGRKVELGKIMQGDVKKFKVYVNNDKGNVVKVNFGQKGMTIKKDNPEARKSFRARMNCDSPGPRWKARYWSCRKW